VVASSDQAYHSEADGGETVRPIQEADTPILHTLLQVTDRAVACSLTSNDQL
jgi:hypothetical protein